MMTKIAWTDESWNPVIGCTKVSEGCLNCYAEKMAGRLWHIQKEDGGPYKDLGCYDGKWNGRVVMIPEVLDKPLHWRKPRRIFVCSMGDLFHEKVPFEFIDKVMQTVTVYPQHHIFQVLTKRPKRMATYFEQLYVGLTKFHKGKKFQWPFRNLWLGVTAENQKCADERIPILLQIPAAVRFVSVEPMLEAVNIQNAIIRNKPRSFWYPDYIKERLHWVIIGCESGPKRRECKLEWVRDLVEQCKAAGVKLFIKQLDINGKVEHNIEKFPKDLRLREYPK